MPGLVPGIHVLYFLTESKTWIRRDKPGPDGSADMSSTALIAAAPRLDLADHIVGGRESA